MLIRAQIDEKHMGSKLLFRDLEFALAEGARVGLIGRNGIGKSTLFGLLAGTDTDFSGSIERKSSLRVVTTAQEHFSVDHLPVLDYLLAAIPNYFELKQIIDTYPETMGSDLEKIQTYTEAIQAFTDGNYYTAPERIFEALSRFDISEAMALRPLGELSGGQKRFVELVKVAFAEPDLILLDEPTNHLDYHGKDLFLFWLQSLKTACCIITHDRDVLEYVESIIEIKDHRAVTYPGNYSAYIRQNGTDTVTQVAQYETALRRLEVLHAQVQTANARKAGASDSRPRILADRLQRQYDELKASLHKPSFWIDRETTANLGKESAASYGRYKSKAIQLDKTVADRHTRELLAVSKLSVGYAQPLFKPLSFRLEHGHRLQLRGRNGAGKSTLISTLLSHIGGLSPNTKTRHSELVSESGAKLGQILKQVQDDENGENRPSSESTIFGGEIKASNSLRIGVYEQEIDQKYLPLTLGKAVEAVYLDLGEALSDQAINAILSRYLFDPTTDKQLLLTQLSGGQKARFQLIRMLSNNPNLLILDEPTNHLDLISIEELESAVQQYPGAVIYVSHDSRFIDHIGGETIQVGNF